MRIDPKITILQNARLNPEPSMPHRLEYSRSMENPNSTQKSAYAYPRASVQQTLQKLKYLAKEAVGKKLLSKPTRERNMESFGSEYGGWDVISTEIDHPSIVYSFARGAELRKRCDLIMVETMFEGKP